MALFAVLFICLALTNVQTQQNFGGMPIVVKDKGIVELKKNEVAMVFYVTVTNRGLVPIYLSVNGTRCCQTITHDDEDCLSMKLLGAEMGELFPQDSRNLTLLYVNLLPHNRVGYCDVVINDNAGRSMAQNIKFNTTLVKGDKVNVPRLLQNYYDSTVFKPCDSVDKDPLNLCKPYNCYIRYDGQRSRWNYTSERCENIPRCMTENENDLAAYNVDSGTCVRIKQTVRNQDYAEFKEGKPSIATLAHEHGYPVNIRCHNGKEDKTGHWCECNKGWVSAPFDQKYFNPDIQVYHMCTIWTGKMSAEEARNITVLPKPRYKTTNIVIITILALSGIVAVFLIAYLLHKLKLQARSQAPEEEEMEFLGKKANGSSE